MSYDSAITELRQLLSDTSTHKKSTKKKLIGDVNGDNKVFHTYDKRILEDTLELYVNDLVVNGDVDDAAQGKLTLNVAPDKNSKVTASYYWQWWSDDELKTFLNKGAELVSQVDNVAPENAYLQVAGGLKTSALYFSASYALDSLINFLINRRHSQEFLIEEDGNDDNKFSATIGAMRDQSKEFWNKAKWARDDYYQRQGQRNIPSFGVKTVSSRRYGPYR